jgi:hypothetical protein
MVNCTKADFANRRRNRSRSEGRSVPGAGGSGPEYVLEEAAAASIEKLSMVKRKLRHAINVMDPGRRQI